MRGGDRIVEAIRGREKKRPEVVLLVHQFIPLTVLLSWDVSKVSRRESYIFLQPPRIAFLASS